MARYTVKVVAGSRTVSLLVVLSPSQSCSALLDKVRSRLPDFSVPAHGTQIILRLDTQFGPVLDLDDLLSDVLPNTDETVYAVVYRLLPAQRMTSLGANVNEQHDDSTQRTRPTTPSDYASTEQQTESNDLNGPPEAPATSHAVIDLDPLMTMLDSPTPPDITEEVYARTIAPFGQALRASEENMVYTDPAMTFGDPNVCAEQQWYDPVFCDILYPHLSHIQERLRQLKLEQASLEDTTLALADLKEDRLLAKEIRALKDAVDVILTRATFKRVDDVQKQTGDLQPTDNSHVN
ncbi:hypothetical protein J4E85_010971 [Alternaria conjuncta]|uniref:uncharacterized protein n=1 Tax=Alternaria viburni TaxID=566460 RepID=UPI0020C40C9E|nr:uncharacterized protein J4E79_008612 [Alternaria viburni]XP_051321038.1 uncharacterized protein J4E85_010971 [Alternaria conjuncta]KAI4653099.1 hypothetical protein J4E79_008612 [Alternaria viburni]KAI4912996.1 hypothetical protein J4E85_010971 [Alternaria conjuncta]